MLYDHYLQIYPANTYLTDLIRVFNVHYKSCSYLRIFEIKHFWLIDWLIWTSKRWDFKWVLNLKVLYSSPHCMPKIPLSNLKLNDCHFLQLNDCAVELFLSNGCTRFLVFADRHLRNNFALQLSECQPRLSLGNPDLGHVTRLWQVKNWKCY